MSAQDCPHCAHVAQNEAVGCWMLILMLAFIVFAGVGVNDIVKDGKAWASRVENRLTKLEAKP